MNDSQTPEAPKQENPIEPQHVVDVLKYCVRQYAVEHELNTDEVRATTFEDLVTWCLKQRMPVANVDEICKHTYGGGGIQPEGSKISPYAVQAVWESFQQPYSAVKLLMPLWPWITDKRPPLLVRPVLMELKLAMVFNDQTAMQIAIPTRFAEKSLSTGFLCSLMFDQALSLVDSVSDSGVDVLRLKYAKPYADISHTEGEPLNGD